MHKKGIIILLAALIITNIFNLGRIKAYEETKKENTIKEEQNLQVIETKKSEENLLQYDINTNESIKNEEKDKENYTESRTFECKINIHNPQFGSVEGVNNGDIITHTTYFSNLSDSWNNTTATLEWTTVEEGKTTDEIAQIIAEKFAIDIETAKKDTDELIKKMKEAGFVVE